MSWDFDETLPIYMQLMHYLKTMIASGEIRPGEKFLSVRELAQTAGVNPNTMQRAFAELEREDLIYAQRTSGRFVTEDKQRIAKLREDLADEKIRSFLVALFALGFKEQEVFTLVEKYMKEMKKNDKPHDISSCSKDQERG